jgi:FKBP-type peptidyl-prolyl cis-trans isomerase FkpA
MGLLGNLFGGGDAGQHEMAGKAFLAKNAKADGVVQTASGLQYKVLTAGDGEKPDAADTVRVHYEGRLLDGSIFDSSYQRGETITFPLNGVIRGWTEGLQLMAVGATHELYIPFNLAYGQRGMPPTIPPCATLIFKVELIGIE